MSFISADLLKDLSAAAYLVPAMRARLCGYTAMYLIGDVILQPRITDFFQLPADPHFLMSPFYTNLKKLNFFNLFLR